MSGALSGERAVVIGAGVAGRAAALALVAEGAEVRVSEARGSDALGDTDELVDAGVDLRADGHDRSHLEGASLVVVSPGVPPEAPILRWARGRAIPVWGELELGARLARVPYLAVTGTNGKTTTTGMIEACLRADGLDAVACGNIGRPFPTTAREAHDVLVVECSSFQLALQDSFAPRVSVLLNVAPDHLDWHGTLDGYASAKARVFAGASPDDVHVGNRDDAVAADVSRTAPCRIVWFGDGAPDPGEVGYVGDELVSRQGAAPVELGAIATDRAGYREDAAAAAAAALAFGASTSAVAEGLSSFEPARHRGDVVAVVEGVRFVDNSKATNVHAALAALWAMHDVVLIAGGRAKGVDLAPLASASDRLRTVVAIGEAAGEVRRIFEGLVPVHDAATIEDAVATAFGSADRGATVLLAPACASWDMFRDYAERGDRFAEAARALGRRAGVGG